jgi:hypothetical protein
MPSKRLIAVREEGKGKRKASRKLSRHFSPYRGAYFLSRTTIRLSETVLKRVDVKNTK